MIIEYLQWWYGVGLKQFWRWWYDSIDFVIYYFSPLLLVRTLFEPWKRDVVYYGNSLEARFNALIANMVSRLIGFILRLALLIFGIISICIYSLAILLSTAMWVLLLPIVIYLIITTLA